MQELKSEIEKVQTLAEKKEVEPKISSNIQSALQERISNNAKNMLQVRQEIQAEH